VVVHDGQIGEGIGQCGDVLPQAMEDRRIEHEPALLQLSHTVAELRVLHHAGGRAVGDVRRWRVCDHVMIFAKTWSASR
jgi:hypothetical protein